MSKMDSILSRPSNTVERASKQAPAGHYTVVITGQPRFDKSSKKGTEFVEFTEKFLAAHEDVDEDQLEEFLTKGDGSKKKLSECVIKDVYYITEDAAPRLARFLDHLDGVKPEDVDTVEETLEERIAAAPGKQVVIQIRHEPRQSGDGVVARVASSSIAE